MDEFQKWYDSAYADGMWIGQIVDDEMARFCWESGRAELQAENKRIKDMLAYAESYMDEEQVRYMRTELWPEEDE